MNIFRLAFELFIIYLLYKFIFGLVIPIYRTTRQMKRKMAEMQQQMGEQQPPSPYSEAPRRQTAASKISDDYIEYEEVK